MDKVKSVVVLSDFRREPYLAVLDLISSKPRPRVLISEVSLLFGGLGDQIAGWQRSLLTGFLKVFSEVEVIPNRLPSGPHDGCRGCMSSLVSMTFDEDARPEEYPREWRLVNTLCDGASDVASAISDDVTRVYVFNGRLASVRTIATRHQTGEPSRVWAYEYGSRPGTYRLEPYSIHDFQRISGAIVRFAMHRQFVSDDALGFRFIEQKLNSRFAAGHNAGPSKEYRTVIFAGSPHEYRWALDHQDYLDADLSGLLSAALRHPRFQSPAALRLHPNSAVSRNFELNEKLIRKKCDELGVDLIGAQSSISTRALIAQSNSVMVGGSSVALDAFLLGQEPIFLGPNSYRGLIEEVISRFGTSQEAGLKAASLAASYAETTIVRQKSWVRVIGKIWAALRKWNRFIDLLRRLVSSKA